MKRNIARIAFGLLALTFCFVWPNTNPSAAGSRNSQPSGEAIEGSLEVVAECDGHDDRVLYFVNTGKERVQLNFASKPTKDLKTGMQVSITRTGSGDEFTADEKSTESLAVTSLTALSNTTGEHRVAVILVNFQDNSLQPYTPEQARDAAFVTTNNYYREASYGQTSIVGDVFGWYTIPLSSTVCDTAAIATYAQQAATRGGADLSAYSHLVYAFPQTSACTFSGRGSIGGTSTNAWINSNMLSIEVLGHELGHNLGLMHSRSMDCGIDVIGQNCSVNEYGDTFDLMGLSRPAHFNLYQKEQLGWVNGATSPPLRTVTESGTYRIDAFETAGTSAKGLKILKSIDPVTGLRTWYYIEQRTPFGFDSYLSAYGVQNGVIVHLGTEGSGQEIYLLDMTPSTSSWYDSTLLAGNTFTDSGAQISITTVSADSTGAWVNVSLPAPACTRSNPTISASPGRSTWLTPGASFAYTVNVTNNNSTGCSASTFNLAAAVPSGWFSLYSAEALTLASGQSSSATVFVTSPLGTADGSYNVGVTANDAGAAGYSSAASVSHQIVTRLAVSSTAGSSKYARSQKATVTSAVAAGGSALPGIAVNFTMTKPNGEVVNQTVITASNGAAVFAYTFDRRRDPLGTYQISSTSSANGLSGQATTSFQVVK